MIKGSVDALELDRVLQLLHDSGSTGELSVSSGSQRHLLRFRDGHVLMHSGEGDGPPTTQQQFEEQFFELLFIDHGTYRFRSRALPPSTDTTQALDTRALLVEASRRKDEWRRIHHTLPSLKVIALPTSRQDELDAQARLQKLGIKEPLRFGAVNFEHIIASFESPFTVLQALCSLCEEGVLSPLAKEEILRQIEQRLDGKPRRTAYRLYEWMLEIPELCEQSERYDHRLLREPWLDLGGFDCRTSGPRALHLLSRLLRYKENFEFSARGGDASICINARDDLLTLHYLGPAYAPPPLARIRERGLLSDDQLSAATAIAELYQCDASELLVDRGYLSPQRWLKLRLEQFLDAAFSLFVWKQPQLRVRKEPSQDLDFLNDPETETIVIPLSQELRDRLRKGLLKWKLFRQVVPSMDAIFRCAKPSPQHQGRRAHDHLDGRRRVRDLLAMARATPQELLSFLYRAVGDGRLEALSEGDHRAYMRESHEAGRPAELLSFYESALAFGYLTESANGKIDAMVAEARTRNQRSNAISVLQASLEHFNLAEVIQLLLQSSVEGTLRVSHALGERVLHFVDGGIYVLLSVDKQSNAAPDEFLSSAAGELLEQMLASRTTLDEGNLEELRELSQEQLLDALLWDRAELEFARNYLPENMFSDSPTRVTLKLPEERLLFEAMRRMAEWDELRHVLRSQRAVFKFRSEDQLEAAVAERGDFIRLIDGTRSLRKLIKTVPLPTIELYRHLYELIEEGHVAIIHMRSTKSRTGTERMRWDLR